MSFFMSADYSLSTKVMEVIYVIIGLLCIYCGVKNLKDKENPEPMGTFIFCADVYKRQDRDRYDRRPAGSRPHRNAAQHPGGPGRKAGGLSLIHI